MTTVNRLYEQQSTFNPNMPLRGLFYFANLLQQFVEEKGYNIYNSTLLPLPNPRFVVFYNGDNTIPERSILKLSDAFENKEKSGCLEVEALMLDVNIGKNLELMQSCRYLQEYTIFVGKVKEYKEQYKDLDTAIDKAIDYCMEHDIMKELLRKHRAEVARLIFREFDEAEYMRQQEKEKEVYKEQIALQKEQLAKKDEQLSQKDEHISKIEKELSEMEKKVSECRKLLEEHKLLNSES